MSEESKSEATARPWCVDPDDKEWVRGADGRHIVDCARGYFFENIHSNEANAALIVAAVNAYNPARDALLAEAVEALEPFAAEADHYEPDDGDGAHVAWVSDFTIASLRRARDTLARLRSALAEGGEG